MNPTIRNIEPGDEPAVIALFDRVFGSTRSVSYWHWKYRYSEQGIPRSKIAVTETGETVGHAGAVPLSGWATDQPLPIYQICDVMVHPNARGGMGTRNLFTQLARTLLEDIGASAESVFAYGFPGERPFLLGERVKVYERIETTRQCTRQVRRDWTLPLLRLAPLPWDDARIDRIWARLRIRIRLGVIRDRDYLRWRYAEHPHTSYQLLGVRFAGQLLGWLIVVAGTERLDVVDLLLPKQLIGAVLRQLDQYAAALSISEIRCWLPPGWRKTELGGWTDSGIVATNMVWRLPLGTKWVAERLYYTMADVDVF